MIKRKIHKVFRKSKYVVYKQTILNPSDHFWTFIGAFIGIASLGYLQGTQFGQTDNILLIGSFGATSVLIFGATNSPLAQPRNLIFGHVISAFIGVLFYKLIPDNMWLSSALAVSLSIVAMQITKTLHPPGGATALIANIGSEQIKSLGFYYVLSPVLSGVLILFTVAVIVNNIPKNRSYPYKK